jgi:hypothetical protein
MVDLLSGGSEEGISGDAARALGILAVGNVDVAAAMVAAGALPPLVELLRGGSDEVKMCAAKVLARDLAESNIDIAAAVVTAGATPPLVEMMSGGSDEVKMYDASALQSLGVGESALAAAIVRAGGHDSILSAILRNADLDLSPYY